MRRFLSILALAAGLASAATFEVRNRQECYTLPEDNQGECLSTVRAGRAYQMESKERANTVSVQVDSASRKYPNIPRGGDYRESPKVSLEERSVIAQEKAVKAQESMAMALWVQVTLTVLAVVSVIVAVN